MYKVENNINKILKGILSQSNNIESNINSVMAGPSVDESTRMLFETQHRLSGVTVNKDTPSARKCWGIYACTMGGLTPIPKNTTLGRFEVIPVPKPDRFHFFVFINKTKFAVSVSVPNDEKGDQVEIKIFHKSKVLTNDMCPTINWGYDLDKTRLISGDNVNQEIEQVRDIVTKSSDS